MFASENVHIVRNNFTRGSKKIQRQNCYCTSKIIDEIQKIVCMRKMFIHIKKNCTGMGSALFFGRMCGLDKNLLEKFSLDCISLPLLSMFQLNL
jgi:hypothetical protein